MNGNEYCKVKWKPQKVYILTINNYIRYGQCKKRKVQILDKCWISVKKGNKGRKKGKKREKKQGKGRKKVKKARFKKKKKEIKRFFKQQQQKTTTTTTKQQPK